MAPRLAGLEGRGRRRPCVPAPAGLVIILYAFTTEDRTYRFPPPGLTLHWFEVAFARSDIWAAMRLSLLVAAAATGLALVLGTLAALALARQSFRGRDTITLLFVLPIALPGIVTGIALLAGDQDARPRARRLDHRRGARDLLPGDRLQQRGRAPAPPAAELDRGLDGSRRQAAGRPSASWCCRRSPPRCWPAACSPLRCPSTRSSSRCSRQATSRPCPSGSTTNCSVRASGRSPTSSR